MRTNSPDVDLSHRTPTTDPRASPDYADSVPDDVWRITLENLAETVLLTDTEGTFTFVCPNVHHIFELSDHEVNELGNVQNLLDLDPSDLKIPPSPQRLDDIERTLLTPSGQFRDLHIYIRAVESEHGDYLFSCRDITQQKTTQQNIRDIAHHLPGVLWMTDMEFRPLYVSPVYEEFFGLPRNNIEENPLEYLDVVHPEDRPAVEDQLQSLQDDPDSGPYEVDYRVVREESVRWLHSKGDVFRNPRRSEDRIIGYTIDITDQKREEEQQKARELRFRQMAENIQQVFWLSTVDKQVLYVSPAFEEIWGIPADRLYEDLGVFFERIHPEDRDRVREAMFEEQTVGDYDEEYRIIRPDGEERWIHDEAFPVRNEEGEIYRIAGIAEDITERKELEEELKDSLDKQTTLLQEVHHRVKNNLQLIISLMELQLRSMDHPDPNMASAFQNVENRIFSMALIHNQIYDQESFDELDARDYLETLSTHVLQTQSLPDQNLSLLTDIEPVSLDVDTLLPSGIIVNELVTNAIKHGFSEQEEGTIRIEFDEDEQGTYRLVVSDDGRGGLDEESLESEAGLGLRLVKNLVRNQLNGTINFVESHDGTTVDIRLRPEQHAGP